MDTRFKCLIPITLLIVLVLNISFVSAGVWNLSLNDDLVAYYNFDEIDTNITDTYGTFNGTLINGTHGQEGLQNNSYYFNGDGNGFVLNGSVFNQSLTTISFWMNVTSVNVDDRIFKHVLDATHENFFYFNTSNGVRWRGYDDVQTWILGDTQVFDGVGDWVHFVLQWDNLTSSNVTIWRNGNLKQSKEMDKTYDYVRGAITFLVRSTDNSSNGLECYFDEMGIWNSYLTPDQVRLLYNDGLGISRDATETSQTYNNTVIEGSVENFILNMTYDSSKYSDIFARLYYNGTSYSGTQSGSGDYIEFSRIITVPNVNSNQNVTFYWEFGLYDGLWHYYNSTAYNQTVINIELDGCDTYDIQIFNFTYLPEENISASIDVTENTTIDITVDVYLKGRNVLISNFSHAYSNTNHADVCINLDINNSEYELDLITEYYSDDRTVEYFSYDNYSLTNTSLYNNISLYGLLLTDSTSFIITYTDEYNLKVSDAIISILRYYTGIGTFKEVERPKTNNLGEAIAHLVEEDVIYKFNVTKYNQQLFISDEYKVYCSSTTDVCTIDLSNEDDVGDFDDDYDNLLNGTYSLTSDASTRNITLAFKLDELGTMNLSVFRLINSSETQWIDDGTLEALSGSIQVHVPVEYGNHSYYVKIYKDGEFVDSRWIGLKSNDPRVLFSSWMPFLVALIVLSLGFLMIASGFGVIIFAVLGLILSMILNIIYLPYSILMFIICAGLIIIFKLITKKGRL